MTYFRTVNDNNSVLPAIKTSSINGNIRLFESANKGGAKRKSRKGKKGGSKRKRKQTIRRACF
jgi:hypothetical protein